MRACRDGLCDCDLLYAAGFPAAPVTIKLWNLVEPIIDGVYPHYI